MQGIGIGIGILAVTAAGLIAFKKYNEGTPFTANPDLSGKVAIVTGCNVGIGYETARRLAGLKAHVIMACRNRDLALAALDRIKSEHPSSSIEFMELDLSSIASIRKFVDEFHQKPNETRRLDFLINNAGAMPTASKSTQDGFELTFGANHLGPFLLTNLLLEDLKRSSPSRIVNVASMASEYGTFSLESGDISKPDSFTFGMSYAQSKLCNVLFTMELADRLSGSGVTAYSLHPGSINSDFARDIPIASWLLKTPLIRDIVPLKTPEQGAQTTLYCTLQPGIEQHSGRYFSNSVVQSWPHAQCQKDQAVKLWEFSERLINSAQ